MQRRPTVGIALRPGGRMQGQYSQEQVRRTPVTRRQVQTGRGAAALARRRIARFPRIEGQAVMRRPKIAAEEVLPQDILGRGV